MNDEVQTEEQLIQELTRLRQKGAELKASEIQHKRTKENSQESEEKYRMMVENASEGIIVAQDGMLKFANPKVMEFTGYSLNELISKPFVEFIHQDDREMVLERHIKRLKGEKLSPNYPFRWIDKNGLIRWIEINVVVTDWEGRPATLLFLKDITERKRTEEKIKEYTKDLEDSEARYRGLYESSIDGIASVNMEGKVVGCNQAFANMHGYTKEELYQLSFRELTLSKWHDKVEKVMMEQVVTRGYSDEFEIEGITKDGTIFPVSVRGWLVKDNNGDPSGIWGIVRDITERKITEKALHESEEKYRTLVEQSRQGLIIMQDQRIVFTNTALAEISGYTVEELLALSPEEVKEIVHSEDRKLVEARIRDRIIGMPVPPHHEFRLIRKDGSIRWLDASSTRIEYRGKPAIQGTLVDITERKVAEEKIKDYTENLEKLVEERTSELKESELQYRTTLDSMGDMIHVVDTDLRIILINTSFKQLNKELGLETDVIGKKVFDVFPFLPDSVLDEYRQVFDTGKALITEGRIKIRDRKFITETRKIPIFGEGRVTQVVTVVRDITERKQAEEKIKEYAEDLKASEARYRGLYESSIDGIIATNLKGNVVDCNQTFADMLGYSKEELSQLTYWDLTHSKGLDTVAKICTEHAIPRGYSDEFEIELLKKDGTFVPVSVRSWLLKDKDGKTVGGWAIIRDIAERKKLDQVKSQFINVAAHELRTPLSALKAHVDLLKIKNDLGYWNLPDEVKEKITIISRNTERLAVLTNNLLDYTRLEAGTVKIKMELGSLDAVVVQVINEVLPLAKKHGHALDLVTPEILPPIHMDKELIHRIFSNLLTNAIKYTPDDGTINVTIMDEGDNIHVIVKDTGIGIPEDDLEKIFQPFHVADIPESARFHSEFERTGLGLAITKEYVKMHGGTIWAESRLGKGSTFHVVFPKKRDEVSMRLNR